MTIKRREVGSILFWNRSHNYFEVDLLSQTDAHSLVLQQLIVTFKVLSTATGFKYEIMLGRFWLDRLPYLFENCSSNVLNKFARGSYELLFYYYRLFVVWVKFRDVNLCFYVYLVIECFTKRRLEHIAWVRRSFIL